jgi:carbon storage regulator
VTGASAGRTPPAGPWPKRLRLLGSRPGSRPPGRRRRCDGAELDELELHPGLRAALAQRGVGLTDALFRAISSIVLVERKRSILLIVHGSLTMVPPIRSKRDSGRRAMLVLTRKSNQSLMIGDDIEVTVLSIMGEKVRIGIQAPREIPVFRKEVYLEIQQENAAARASAQAEVDDALKRLSPRLMIGRGARP